MTVGLIDWGIGGLSVYRELLQQRPAINCIYLSDSGATPYGRLKKNDLIKRLDLASDFFRQKGISDIVIACNAASTVIDELRLANSDLTYYGMLDSGAELLEKSKAKKVLIIGGKRTIRSGYFQKYFKNSKIQIQAKAAQPLSAFIESGDMNSKKFDQSLTKILSRLKLKPEVILLACTHYPAIEKQIKRILPFVKTLDPAQFVIAKLPVIKKNNLKLNHQFFTTGSVAAMKKSSLKAFQIQLLKVTKIRL